MSSPDAQLTHVGIFVCDLERMVAFYSRLLGLVLTDRGTNYRGDPVAFLSRNSEEHHQLVLAAGREAGQKTTLQQLSFHVRDLEDLQRFHPKLVAEGVAELLPRNHGNAWSIYFNDPEGNRVELYTHTPWHVAQPYGKELDLSDSAEAIRQKTLAMVRDDPTFVPRERWAAELEARIR